MMFTLIVPKNEEGIINCETGRDDSGNESFYTLSKEEYNILRKNKVFDILNDKFDLWIDEGETEKVTSEQLKKAYNAITPVKGEWTKAVDEAIRAKTFLCLVF